MAWDAMGFDREKKAAINSSFSTAAGLPAKGTDPRRMRTPPPERALALP
jgi:hypothetical protein